SGITAKTCYEVSDGINYVTVDCSGLVDVDEDTAEEFSIYPNPTTGEINIKASTEFVSARVTNLAGQTFEYNITGNSLNVSNLAAGLYIIDLESANGTVEKSKFIKK
ncbi:MAG: T9SS type A sorting domain-containing protein, partial [Bacteroidales bacterium]|nr:T9SS type A sorting domain-containing protein [Bacteroidales bacterium]